MRKKANYRFLEPKERMGLIKVLDSKLASYRRLEASHERLHEKLTKSSREINSIKKKIETGKEYVKKVKKK